MDSYSDQIIEDARDSILHEIQVGGEKYLRNGVCEKEFAYAVEAILVNDDLPKLLALAVTGLDGVKILQEMSDVLADDEACIKRIDRDVSLEMERRADERRIMGDV